MLMTWQVRCVSCSSLPSPPSPPMRSLSRASCPLRTSSGPRRRRTRHSSSLTMSSSSHPQVPRTARPRDACLESWSHYLSATGCLERWSHHPSSVAVWSVGLLLATASPRLRVVRLELVSPPLPAAVSCVLSVWSWSHRLSSAAVPRLRVGCLELLLLLMMRL
jgi:hypothetical protein